MIGDRIFNLDQIAFAQREILDGKVVVYLAFDDMTTVDVQPGQQRKGGKKNVTFMGNDADFVWEKLSKLADRWVLPSGDAGHWPQIATSLIQRPRAGAL